MTKFALGPRGQSIKKTYEKYLFQCYLCSVHNVIVGATIESLLSRVIIVQYFSIMQ